MWNALNYNCNTYLLEFTRNFPEWNSTPNPTSLSSMYYSRLKGDGLMYRAAYTDKAGNLHRSTYTAAASRGSELLIAAEYIPLPAGATLTSLPGRKPLAFNHEGQATAIEGKGESWALGALLPQGFTRTLLPAYEIQAGPEVLPLLGYTAVAFDGDKVMVAAKATDEHHRWHPKHFNTGDLPQRIARAQRRLPKNRIIAQLANCSLEYGCFTAQNIFYRRWEGGLPVSPTCNAQCLGCISKQESECCPSPQGRIAFTPTVEEGAEVALWHLTGNSKGEIISFGQGCEGEPSLAAETIVGIISLTRSKTDQGAININTNAGDVGKIKTIVDSGLDSMRVSLISATPRYYDAYYRPRGYGISDVERSIAYAVDRGVHVSLNLLTLPGFNDREEEIDALLALIRRTGLQKVQIRNLNIDDEFFYRSLAIAKTPSIGIDILIDTLRNNNVEVGNYTTLRN